MVSVTRSADCGNSPKNKAVEDLAVSLEGGTWSGDLIGPETLWTPASGDPVKGLTAIMQAAAGSPKAITVDRVTTHGKVGAASGMTDGKRFAHIITFTSATANSVAAIDSFRKNGTAHG